MANMAFLVLTCCYSWC